MAGDKEIKLTEEEFETAIGILTDCKNELTELREYYIKLNTEMKDNWAGDSATAFIISEKLIEQRFQEQINDLENEIGDLKSAQFTMFKADKKIANIIAGHKLKVNESKVTVD